MKKVEVKSNGIVIGYSYDDGDTIDFLDNDEAKKVLHELNFGTTIYISSRKRGDTDLYNNITEIGDVDELIFVEGKN